MIARLLATLVLALVPAAAVADGGHHDHGDAPPLGTAGTVTVQGYQVELLTHPSPLTPERTGHVVAKVVRSSDLTPVPGGRVLIGFAPAGATLDAGPAAEQTWAGHYAVAASPSKVGAHQVRVVLAELEGRHFEPPLVVDFPISVARASAGMGAVAWTVIALVAGIGVLAMYAVWLRARTGAPAGEALNLLRVQWLRRILTSRAFQPSLQIPLLALMGVVVLLGFYDVQDGGKNLATKLTWTIWWAGIIFTFVLAGRVWCLACPFGALNEWTSRLAAPLRRLPKSFRNLWWATGMFVLLTWADEQLGVVRSPLVTAWIVLFFAAAAVAVGLFYERRSFCRHLCPIGGLIGIYSMTAPLELRAKSSGVCAGDPDKSCYRGGPESHGCPMFEFPASMDRNNYCNLCGECVTACVQDNLILRFRALGKDLWASGRRVLDEAYLAVALVGITLLVTAQMLTAWSGWTWALSGALPQWVRASFKPVTYLGLVESAILLGGSLVIVPILVLAAAAVGDRLAGESGLGVRRTFVLFSYMFIPVGLAVHLAHNLSHLLLEGGGIVPVVQRVVSVYTPWSLGEPDWQRAPLAPEAVIAVLQVAIIVGFFVLSLIAGHRLSAGAYSDPRAASRALLPMAVLSCLFTVAAIVLLNQPMGMRHGI
jgi:polyferredoxin